MSWNGVRNAIERDGQLPSGRGGSKRPFAVKVWHCRGASAIHNSPRRPLRIEQLEQRALLDATAVFDHIVYDPIQVGGSGVTPAYTSPPSSAFSPSQIQTAYGISAIRLGAVAGTGSGQTIAIVDAYNDPNIISDTATFNTQFGLQKFNVSGGPTLTVRNQSGHSGPLPGTDPNGPASRTGKSTWEEEESLDVEWAHAVAPQANIILFEANSPYMSDLMTAVLKAASSGVSVVSMSFGTDEFSGETSYDSDFVAQGVTFVASTGDGGSPGEYPAYSPDVVAVGGTSLSLNSDNTYKSETAWSDSGGGKSTQESEPSYQQPVQTTGMRQTPDVSFDADPYTGVAIYDSYDYSSSPWLQIGGTSLSAPCWAGLVAIANQLRVADKLTALNTSGPTQAQATLYSIDAADFHDVTSGSNGGYSAGPGYDLVTGLGTPLANKLVPDLALYPGGSVTNPATTVSLTASTNATQYTQPITFDATVDKIDPGVAPPTGTVTFMDGSTAMGAATLSRGMALFTYSTLALGSHTITAVYGGDATFTAASSATVAEAVAQLATTTSVGDSAGSITYGGQETLTATVTAVAPGYSITPSGGTVTFTSGSTTLGSASLVAGTATLATTSLPAGTDQVTASYNGAGSNFASSATSGPVAVKVTPAPLTVTPANQTKTYGSPFTAFSGTITGIQNGDNLTASYSSSGAAATASVSGSPYTITFSIRAG
ncbi:MAG: Ig-like domain repeat protein [Thermoguttaceae bacterium]